MQKYIFIILLLFLFILNSCNSDTIHVPKPRMYPKIEYPQKAYQVFDSSFCNMTFEYPKYATIKQDQYFFEGKPIDPCWFDINFTDFNGTLHCSYFPIKNRKHYDQLIFDSFRLVEEHNGKASYRQEEQIKNKHGVAGLYFSMGGQVATNMQFFLTDTTNHFFRGSLYFNAKVEPDSLKPIYQFVKEDVDNLLESFQWK